MTTLAVTPDIEAATITVEITDAPQPGATVYHGDAETDIDGWVKDDPSGTMVVSVGRAQAPIEGAWSWFIDWWSGATAADTGAKRTVTGLTPGAVYLFTANAVVYGTAPDLRLGVEGVGEGGVSVKRESMLDLSYTFTATATSHDIYIHAANSNGNSYGSISFDNVTVGPGSVGPLTLTRTDVNGTQPVRLAEGQELESGALTVVDHEAAMNGAVTYDVVDGEGEELRAVTSLQTYDTALNLAPNPLGPDSPITGWTGQRTTRVANGDGITATVSATGGEQYIRTPSVGQAGAITVTPGQTIYASLQMRGNVAVPTSVGIQWYSAAGALLSTVRGAESTPSATSYSTYSITATAPTSAAVGRLLAGTANAQPAAIGTTFDVRRVMVKDSPFTYSLDRWFDGYSAASSWTGTPYETTSYRVEPNADDYARQPRLNIPLRPSEEHQALAVVNYDSTRQTSHTIHDIINRNDPLVTLGRMRTRRGTLQFREPSFDSAKALEAMYTGPDVVLLRLPYEPRIDGRAFADIYHVGTQVRVSPGDHGANGETHWLVDVEYAEVASPVGETS